MASAARQLGGIEDEVDFMLTAEFPDSSPSELATAIAEARAFDGTEEDRRKIVVELRMRARARVVFWPMGETHEGPARAPPAPVKPSRQSTTKAEAKSTRSAPESATAPAAAPADAPRPADLFTSSDAARPD